VGTRWLHIPVHTLVFLLCSALTRSSNYSSKFVLNQNQTRGLFNKERLALTRSSNYSSKFVINQNRTRGLFNKERLCLFSMFSSSFGFSPFLGFSLSFSLLFSSSSLWSSVSLLRFVYVASIMARNENCLVDVSN
jgi:hypothetical protein